MSDVKLILIIISPQFTALHLSPKFTELQINSIINNNNNYHLIGIGFACKLPQSMSI